MFRVYVDEMISVPKKHGREITVKIGSWHIVFWLGFLAYRADKRTDEQ